MAINRNTDPHSTSGALGSVTSTGGLRNRVPVVLFVVAMLLRLGWVFLGGREALSSSDDAKAYHDLAVNLVQRHQFVTAIDPPHRLDTPYARRPPLTPFVLATVYLIFGPHLFTGQFLLAFFGAVSVVALYRLGRQLFSEGVGILAGSLATVYPFFVFLAAVPLTENLAILLYILLALLLTKSGAEHTTKHAAITGGVLGLTTLDRPQILGFFPFLVLLVLLRVEQGWANRMRWLGVAVACSAMVIAPWVIRNRVVVGGCFPISLQSGEVLYQGNNPFTQTTLTRLRSGARGWYNDPRSSADMEVLSPLQSDRRAFHLAIAFMREQPGRVLGYSLQKVEIFLRAYDHPLARASWYPVCALSLVGLYWTRRRWRQMLPLYLLFIQTMLTAAVFTSMPRFRAPVEPFFLLMVAFALHQLWERTAAPSSRQR